MHKICIPADWQPGEFNGNSCPIETRTFVGDLHFLMKLISNVGRSAHFRTLMHCAIFPLEKGLVGLESRVVNLAPFRSYFSQKAAYFPQLFEVSIKRCIHINFK